MQSLGNNADPASVPTATTATALSENRTTDTPAAPAETSQAALTTLPANDTPTTSPISAPVDLNLLSALLTPTPFPPSPLPPLSTTAPRLHAHLIQHQLRSAASHSRLHSSLTPTVALTSPLYTSAVSLLRYMSHAEMLRVHLDDMGVLVVTLVEAVGVGVEATLSVLERVIAKQRAIDEVTGSLVGHQQRQQRIEAVKRDIQQLDGRLIHFANTLAAQQLALATLLTPTPTHSTTPLPPRLRPMSVESLVSYAQRLSAVSFAPSDITERKGVSSARPPAPLETEMAASLLQLSPDEMRAWMEARRSDEAAAAGGKQKAAEERKEAMAMPTVAEVETARAGAQAVASGGAAEKKTAAAVSASVAARRAQAAAPAAASLLDLDLNPDMDDSDDEEESDDGG